MTDWHCFKCKKQMVEAELSLTYLEMLGFENGIKCPECGTQYLTEETAVALRAKEAEIEAKMK